MNFYSLALFSELNEKSIILAQDMFKHYIIRGSSHSLKVIFHSSNREAIDRKTLSKCIELGFSIDEESIEIIISKESNEETRSVVFLLSENEEQNLLDVIGINSEFHSRRDIDVLCFSESKVSECIIDGINEANLKVDKHSLVIKRIDTLRQNIYSYIADNSPFEYAVSIHGEKWINIVIIGSDRYTMEMLKALLWCCQMDGYYLRIDLLSDTQNLEEHFAFECPGIVERGNRPRCGEDYYDIHLHEVDFSTSNFLSILKDLPTASWVFLSLGSDLSNANHAMHIREIYAGLKNDEGNKSEHNRSTIHTPKIITVVKNPIISDLLNRNELHNFRSQFYQINAIGSISEAYSFYRLFGNSLEERALHMHLRYGNELDYKRCEYFRRSSMASAIHLQYRRSVIRDNPEYAAIIEHRRWLAFMRGTEGYRYGVFKDDLAKQHHDLTAFDYLSKAEKEKDYLMNGSTSS